MDLTGLYPVFQKGVWVAADTGCSLKSLLCEQWQLADDYVSRRISTLFLDGKPVDDLDAAVVADGAVLALSGAMPGLVGAVMRRDGALAILRSGITHHSEENTCRTQPGFVRVKLFNLLIKELGPLLLARGIGIDPDDVDVRLERNTAFRMTEQSKKVWIKLDV